MAPRPKTRTIDEYLATLSADKRAALERLRKAIHAAAPGAEERIAWRLPAFRFEGRLLVAFGAASKHCALYPMSSATVAAHAEELRGYDTSPGTIRFPADRPLPAPLVRKLVRARIEENRRLRGGPRQRSSQAVAPAAQAAPRGRRAARGSSRCSRRPRGPARSSPPTR